MVPCWRQLGSGAESRRAQRRIGGIIEKARSRRRRPRSNRIFFERGLAMCAGGLDDEMLRVRNNRGLASGNAPSSASYRHQAGRWRAARGQHGDNARADAQSCISCIGMSLCLTKIARAAHVFFPYNGLKEACRGYSALKALARRRACI